MIMDLEDRIKILTDGAKYDVSCSSSGSNRPNTPGGIGNAAICGICHSFTADGRCISLLKMLLSNDCIYNCLYCVNRRDQDVPRATLTPREMCDLTIGFYKRNYIEGLFLSSAVEKTPNNAQQKLFETVYLLRTEYKFNGYIHVKTIPGADSELIKETSLFADRMSVNIEAPSYESLQLIAPQKKRDAILAPMRLLAGTAGARLLPAPKESALLLPAPAVADNVGTDISARAQNDILPPPAVPQNNFIAEPVTDKASFNPRLSTCITATPVIPMKEWKKDRRISIPAGQTTQMVIGATPDRDSSVLKLTQGLYSIYKLKRVYYSAYVPVGSDRLPHAPAPLLRENRLYQADWLLRFYGFTADELLDEGEDLATDVDPKTAWAIAHMSFFPIEVNSATLEELLRVPGIGVKNALRIIRARRTTRLTIPDLKKMRVVLKRAKHFITADGKFDGYDGDNGVLRRMLALPSGKDIKAAQASIFDTKETALSVITGEF